jgi:hypothetical protein
MGLTEGGRKRDAMRERNSVPTQRKGCLLKGFWHSFVTLKERRLGGIRLIRILVFRPADGLKKVVQIKEIHGGKEKARSQNPDYISTIQISISQPIHPISRV